MPLVSAQLQVITNVNVKKDSKVMVSNARTLMNAAKTVMIATKHLNNVSILMVAISAKKSLPQRPLQRLRQPQQLLPLPLQVPLPQQLPLPRQRLLLPQQLLPQRNQVAKHGSILNCLKISRNLFDSNGRLKTVMIKSKQI